MGMSEKYLRNWLEVNWGAMVSWYTRNKSRREKAQRGNGHECSGK